MFQTVSLFLVWNEWRRFCPRIGNGTKNAVIEVRTVKWFAIEITESLNY